MLEALDVFRTRFGGRPFLLFIAFLVLLLLADRQRRFRLAGGFRSMRGAARATSAAGLLALLAYIASAIWYASDPHFFDYAEPTMPAVGWLFHVGHPVYPALDAAERYAHVYGPMAFMLHGFALAALGPSIEVSKGLGAAAGILSLALLYAAMRSRAGHGQALVLTGLFALLLLTFRHYSFWTRPEPFQLAAVSAALLFAVWGRGHASAVAVGVASGILWNLKFTGPLYSLPIFVLLQRRTGWRGVFVAAVTGGVVAALPFVLFSNVSFANYLAWVHLSAHTGLLLSTLRQNLEWAAYLGLPLLLSYYAVARDLRPGTAEWRHVLIALLLGVCGVVIAAAKPGAGSYHLLPFLPVILYVVAWHIRDLSTAAAVDPFIPRAVFACLVTACVTALTQQAQLIETMAERRAVGEIADIERFSGSHQGVIEMGYGTTEALSLERPLLVFRSHAYLLDQPAVREHQLAGLEIPPSTVAAIAGCRVDYWLIPKGESPFSGLNGYGAARLRPLFTHEFRRAFLAAHERVGVTDYFDVWQCRRGAGS